MGLFPTRAEPLNPNLAALLSLEVQLHFFFKGFTCHAYFLKNYYYLIDKLKASMSDVSCFLFGILQQREVFPCACVLQPDLENACSLSPALGFRNRFCLCPGTHSALLETSHGSWEEL